MTLPRAATVITPRASRTDSVPSFGAPDPKSEQGDSIFTLWQGFFIAALAVGLAQGAYEAGRDYAFTRQQFGQPIGRFQSIRAKLVDDAIRIQASRLMTYRAAAMKDAGRRTTLQSAMAKLYSSEIAVKVSDDAVQIHGGYGFVKDYPAEKYFRDVKLTTIGEGTSEIQRLVIARQLLAS